MKADDMLLQSVLAGLARDKASPSGEKGFVKAAEQREFRVDYQPIVSMPSGAIAGAEAIPRWDHPHQDVLSTAEPHPGVGHIGEFVPPHGLVISEACRQLGIWNAEEGGASSISINLSAAELCADGMETRLENALMQNGVLAAQLVLEVSERLGLERSPPLFDRLKLLRKRGYRIVLSDFGACHTSISLLMELPVTGVKFGCPFTATLPGSATSRAILSNVFRLVRDLGLSLTVAGVDKERQFNLLREYSDIELQGELLFKPMNAEAWSASVNRSALSHLNLRRSRAYGI